MIHVRRAGAMDAKAMADLLNEIIKLGGTTAMVTPVSTEYFAGRIAEFPDSSAWHVAEDDDGTLMGFQWIAPRSDPDSCEIATFARVGKTGLGIGSKLFDATRAAAKDIGYIWIDAEIRADNTGGIAYYQSRGFELYGRKDNITLEDGTIVSKELRRYDL